MSVLSESTTQIKEKKRQKELCFHYKGPFHKSDGHAVCYCYDIVRPTWTGVGRPQLRTTFKGCHGKVKPDSDTDVSVTMDFPAI